jgi:hypothetical protein
MERIYKLQPNRTLHLRGFDGLGAAAALHAATQDSFKVSGVFRDPADFCVLILHDSDNFFEHPLLKFLPDSDFDGLTLTFDVHYSGLRTLDSPRYASIDWPYLDVSPPAPHPIELFKHAAKVGGTWTQASGQFTIVDGGMQPFDRVTLWYLNFAFDYIVGPTQGAFVFTARGEGFVHSITVAGTVYSYTEVAGDTDFSIAQRLVDALAASTQVTATRTFNQVNFTAKTTDGQAFEISTSEPQPENVPQSYMVAGASAAAIAANLAAQINAADWADVNMPISAAADGPNITITALHPGEDGNAITLYALGKNDRLKTSQPEISLTGGSSDATWRVTLDFAALGIPSIRQMWLTFSPPLSSGQAFQATEWAATFTDWTLSGPEAKKTLGVAGPGSVRLEDSDSACVYRGTWTVESGFFSRGYAKVAKGPGASVTVSYDCARTHDLYIGTSLYADRGSAGVLLDGVAQAPLNARFVVDSAIVTRRKVASSVPAGHHTVILAPDGSGPFYFDFLEAAIPSDVPDNLPARTNVSPALDYSTDHSYKLPPARLLWMFDKLGFAGAMNEYIGVFWWNQRVRTNAVIPMATVTFNGAFVDGDSIELIIGGISVRKRVFPADTNSTIASHFAHFINATFVGVWAAASSNTLTITSHSPTPDYRFTFTTSITAAAGSTGTMAVDNKLGTGDPGVWTVDPTQSPALNRGAREWHADLFAECAARHRDIVVSSSMELVNPPDNLPARFPDGSPVVTEVGFGSLKSTHCAFNSAMQSYQQQVFDCIAGLMSAAGVTPTVQFGEYCWWYFPSGGGMAFYDSETQAAALAALGRPLKVFETPTAVPTSPDALFLRNRLRDHIAGLISYLAPRHQGIQFEVLFPYDVNGPSPAGVHGLGGLLLRFVNFPAEWEKPATAGFHTLKMEGLDFGASSRDLNLVKQTIRFPLDLGWPAAQVRYLIPVFNGGCPSESEYRTAQRFRIPVINFWAFDHFCIFGLPVREPARRVRAIRV